MIPTQAVFTIATGKPIYLQMACALARSFRVWHLNENITFFLATDADRSRLPPDLRGINIISFQSSQYGVGFEPKLHLDRIAPAARSLFIDADCLCVGSLKPAFESFRGRAVSVIGREINNGKWHGDVAAICRQFNIPAMPCFNGGLYYLEKGDACTRIYETARALLPRYDTIGFKPLRGSPNEEVLLSLALAMHGEKPIADRGDIMNTVLAGPGGVEVDVFRGHSLLRNPKKINSWYEYEEMRPRIVHFLARNTSAWLYRQEITRLQLVQERGWPAWLATVWTKMSSSFPARAWICFKNFLRPVYRVVFGLRSIRSSR
jgi:hypothetical protein